MMLVLSEEEVRQSVTMAEAVPAVEDAFAALARGEARLPDVISLEIPEAQGEVHVKGAHIVGAPYYVFKAASGFWSNPAKGLPAGSGLMLAFDATSGVPAALLLDNGFLTDLRTGAAGGVAARYLARRELHKVAVLGAGVQARCQLQALAEVRKLPAVTVWNRNPERAGAYAEEMGPKLGVAMEVAPDIEDAVGDADLVVTTTPSHEPLIRVEWLAPGAHVTAVGSDGPDKQELDVGVLARADVVVADRLDQCLRFGEIHHAIDAGVLEVDDVGGELGEVVLGDRAGRTDDAQITVADLTGVGVQDAAIASLALEAAAGRGLGAKLP